MIICIQSHRLGEIERAAEDQANEMASSAPEVGTGPTSDMKKRSLQHKQHNKRKNQGQVIPSQALVKILCGIFDWVSFKNYYLGHAVE